MKWKTLLLVGVTVIPVIFLFVILLDIFVLTQATLLPASISYSVYALFVSSDQNQTDPENYCRQDNGCACGIYNGQDSLKKGGCFYGNADYVNTGFNCPDFCSGFIGNYRIRCIAHQCWQVGRWIFE